MTDTFEYKVKAGDTLQLGDSSNIVTIPGTLNPSIFQIGGETLTTSIAALNAINSIATVANKSGSPMVAGELVYISGYDTTLDTDIVSLADADDATKKATLVITEAIADNASGTAEPVATVTGLNTNAFSAVGSFVYESPTAGEWTHTAPTAADDDKRVVGVVKVKSATIGEISFFPGRAGLEHAAVYLNNITPGTAKASGALIVDASVDIAGINTIGATIGNIATLNATNIDAGADAVKGTIDIFPTTTAKGKAIYSCTDQTGNTTVTHQTDAMGQATVVHTGDVGLADAYVAQSTNQLLAAELDVLDAVTPGTVKASGVVVVDASLHQDVVHTASLNLGATGATVAVTSTAAELNYLDLTGAVGIAEASKAVVLDAALHQDVVHTASLLLGASGATVAVTADAVELNRLDDSAEVESVTGAGAVSPTVFNTNLNVASGGAVTLAACPATMVGKIKTIRMQTDDGNVTMALTEVQGGTAATTATFSNVTEELILIGSAGGKWTVAVEFGVVLS